MNPIRIIDDWLNDITMYRLLVYGLSVLAAVSVLFGVTGSLPTHVPALLISLGSLLAICYATNAALRRVWQVASNSESWLITALILFFILPSVTDWRHAAGVGLAGMLAMASKYMLAWHRKHIFNPAAVAAVAVGLLGVVQATWWIGSPTLLPFAVLLGLLIVRKIRRFQMALTFMAVALLVMALRGSQDSALVVRQAFASWPLVFMGTIMLTEPSTSPPRHRQQLLYASVVGVVFALQSKLGPISSTPEVALLIGNLLAYVYSPKYKLRLQLASITRLAPHIYDLAFKPDRRPAFLPGQYMEWTLPHTHADRRGNRRTFTIASSPTEPLIHLGIKTYEPSSSYKKALLALKPGDALIAGRIAGDFTLPADPKPKLAFIAGGIGITPFRSMVQYLIDTRQHRDIVVFYIASDPTEYGYRELLEKAQKYGVRVVYVLTAPEIPEDWPGRTGLLTKELLAEALPDLHERHVYISGPSAMVDYYRGLVRSAGAKHITTDHFSGY